jgi:hypothetical protein
LMMTSLQNFPCNKYFNIIFKVRGVSLASLVQSNY